jgi:hypothetical protein
MNAFAHPSRCGRLCPSGIHGVPGGRVDQPLLPVPAIGRGPGAPGRCRAWAGGLRRPHLPVQRRGRGVPLSPPAVVRAAAGRHRRHRQLPVLLTHGRGLQPARLGTCLRHLGDQPLSVAAFKEAVRAGRTVVTNGPWLTLEGTVALTRNAPGSPSKVGALLHGRAPRRGRITRPCL